MNIQIAVANKHRFIKHSVLGILTLFMLNIISACQQGTPEQAIQTRQAMATQTYLMYLPEFALNTLFARMDPIPDAKALLNRHSQAGQGNLRLTEISFGNYVETTPGSFDFTALEPANSSQSITIEFLDGMNISLASFTTTNEFISGFALHATPNNRGIPTPLSQSVTLTDTQITRYIIPTELLVFNPPSLRIAGNIAFHQKSPTTLPTDRDLGQFGELQSLATATDQTDTNHTKKKYAIDRIYDHLSLSRAETITYHSSLQVWDITDNHKSSIPDWSELQTIIYARVGTRLIAQSSRFTYQDAIHLRDIRWLENDAGPDKISHHISGFVSAKIEGQRWTVAQTTGGPYTCSITDPNLPSTGDPFLLRWSDGHIEKLPRFC